MKLRLNCSNRKQSKLLGTLLSFCGALLLTIAAVPPVNAGDEQLVDGDKVLVVMLYDGHCKKWCNEVKPILSTIKEDYGEKIALHELDVSDTTLKTTLDSAKQLGVASFVKGALDWVPTVGVFTPKRKLIRELPGVTKKEVYLKCIEKALKAG